MYLRKFEYPIYIHKYSLHIYLTKLQVLENSLLFTILLPDCEACDLLLAHANCRACCDEIYLLTSSVVLSRVAYINNKLLVLYNLIFINISL